MKTYAFITRGFSLKPLSRFLMTLGVGLFLFFNIETAQAQDIEITLTWTGGGTWVDLWVTDPNGNIYTWDVPGSGINGVSPDIYTADAGTAINGNYLVEVCYYSAPDEPPDPISATVVIVLRKGTINEQSTTYGPQTITDTDPADSDDPNHDYPNAWWTVTTFSWPPGTSVTGGGGGGSSGDKVCFIATAAYGSYTDEHGFITDSHGGPITDYRSPITVLQKFRDEYLLTNAPGRAFVSYYERISPPIAKYIEDKEPLKAVVRFYLKPIVWGAKKILK